jgi:hypothetical protein
MPHFLSETFGVLKHPPYLCRANKLLIMPAFSTRVIYPTIREPHRGVSPLAYLGWRQELLAVMVPDFFTSKLLCYANNIKHSEKRHQP